MTSSRRSGFTIVELLVAMTIFSVVIAVATGAFIKALRTQRQLVSFAAANSNMSLVLEQMAREIRVGRDFAGSNGTLHFTNAKNEPVEYRYEDLNGGGAILRTVGSNGEQQLTSDNVNVRDLRFVVANAATTTADRYPARITVSVSVSPKEQTVKSNVVHIQTTVSARNIGT